MKSSLRLCIGCNKLFCKSDLLKIKFFEDRVLINPKKYYTGRSAYICCKLDCIEKAKKFKKIQKSLKQQIDVSDNDWESLKKLVLS